MASRLSKKEFRTSVILTEAQFKRVRKIARANDASIAWILRQAVDRYLEVWKVASPQRREDPDRTFSQR